MKWFGPYRVIGTVTPHVYQVQLVGGTADTRRRVHVRRMKRYADRLLNVTERLVDQVHFDMEQFDVDRIVEWRRLPNDKYELRIRWLGYEASWDTWEPLSQVKADVPEMVNRFIRQHTATEPALRRYLS